jgi:hypothetical protein
VTDDVLLEEFFNGGGGYVANRLCLNPFGEVLHCDYSESVVSLCWCKFINNVVAPSLQGPGWAIDYETCAGALERWENF